MGMTENGPARLVTPEDWKDNPEVTERGFLRVWREYSPEYKHDWLWMFGSPIEDGWQMFTTNEVKLLDTRTSRCWTKEPTEKQMKNTPWT